MFMMAAAYRPDRNPEITQALNDLGWFWLTLPPGGLFTITTAVIGICFMRDKSVRPLYPRWVGYLALWIAVLIFPAYLVPFLYSGPFAWNGLLAFWLVVLVASIWMVVLVIYTFKAIRRTDYQAVIS